MEIEPNKATLVVIDESGCTGFKPASSSHFVLGMVIFNSFHDAENTANIIHKLKKEVGFQREFRFSSCDNRKRDMFFEVIKKAPFSAQLFVVEKRLIHSSDLKGTSINSTLASNLLEMNPLQKYHVFGYTQFFQYPFQRAFLPKRVYRGAHKLWLIMYNLQWKSMLYIVLPYYRLCKLRSVILAFARMTA